MAGYEGVGAFVDLATKVVISVAIPVATLVVDQRLAAQTRVIEAQKTAFEDSLKLRNEDVELTLKFYDVINSKRFECFEEAEAPLRNIIIRQHNAYNRITIDEAQIVQSLIQESIRDPNCRVSQDTLLVRQTSDGRVPTATSSATRGDARESSDNALVKNAFNSVTAVLQQQQPLQQLQPLRQPLQQQQQQQQQALNAPTPNAPLPAGAIGWVAVGRYTKPLGFTNFTVLAADLPKVDDRGDIAPDAVLRARWSVYLRLNSADTTQAGNQVLGVLSEGTCVRVKSSVPDLRGQTWAAVALEPSCASGDYR